MADQSFLRGTNLQAPSSEFVTNNTASTLSKFKVVALNGIGEVYPQVVICNINTSSPFGILQGNILPGQSGYVYRVGFIPDIDTSAWSVNTLLYCDNAGNITNVENKSCIGYVVKQNASGVIYTNPAELNNVINTLTANRALISDGSGQVAASGVSSTTLGFLDVTSSIQNQLNGKVNRSGDNLTGTLFSSPDPGTNYYNSIITSNSDPTGSAQIGFESDTYKQFIVGITNSLFDPYVGILPDYAFQYSNVGYLFIVDSPVGFKWVQSGSEIATLINGTFHANTSLSSPIVKVTTATASRVAIVDPSKNVTSSSVTTTTLGYLDATSSIQTQLDTKIDNEQSIINALIFG